jgi:FlaA1/EpsC-like NDP-sugar epimerase
MTYADVNSKIPSNPSSISATDESVDVSLSIYSRFGRALMAIEAVADGVTVALGVIGAFAIYRLLSLGRRADYSTSSIWYIAIAVSTHYVVLLDRDGAYRLGSSLLKIKETERAFRLSAQTFLLTLPITFFGQFRFSRWVFVIATVVVPVLLVSEKHLLVICGRTLRAHNIGVRRVLIYGAGSSGHRVFSALARSVPRLGLKPVAIVDDDPNLGGQKVFSDSYRRQDWLDVLCEPITEELLEKLQCEVLSLRYQVSKVRNSLI